MPSALSRVLIVAVCLIESGIAMNIRVGKHTSELKGAVFITPSFSHDQSYDAAADLSD